MSERIGLRMGNQSGFTLIELMVVVAILAVLAFLVVPKVLETLDKSKLNSGISIANEIANAMERLAAENGEASVVAYPDDTEITTYEELVTVLAGNATLPESASALKYFRGAGSPDVVYATSDSRGNYTLELTSTNRAADPLCVRPAGITVGSCTAP